MRELELIEQASFNGFIKTILIIIFGYYCIKFLAKFFAPIILKKSVEKMQKKFEQATKGQHQQNTGQKTSTQKTDDKKVKSNKKVGEYVDFEEIE